MPDPNAVPEGAAQMTPDAVQQTLSALGGVIAVNGAPLKTNAESSLRVGLIAGGAILAAFGVTKYAGTLTIMEGQAGNVLAVLGGVSAAAAWLYGQFRTYVQARDAAAMAKLLPNTVAVTK